MDDQCGKCDGKCCQYFCFEIDEPDTYEEFDDIRWYLLHEGVTVHIDEGGWYISIANRCNALTPDNRCRIYDERPLICRKYADDDCDYTMGDYGYDEHFITPDQIDAYARKVLGPRKYDGPLKRARKRLALKAKIASNPDNE